MYKYNKVYNEKIKEESIALGLGNLTHTVLEDAIKSDQGSIEWFQKYLDDNVLSPIYPEVYKFIPAMNKFMEEFRAYRAKENIEFHVEGQMGATKNLESVPFFSPYVYIRGVVDLWGYDAKRNQIIIIDHKTNKKAQNKEEVWANNQLTLYGWLIPAVKKLDVEKIKMSLHFVRMAKKVWAEKSYKEAEHFGTTYFEILDELSDQINENTKNNEWGKSYGIHCRWCSFRDECGK